MLTKEKQKALIEAMLFASCQPLSVSKIVGKLRRAARLELAGAHEGEGMAPKEAPDDDNVLQQLLDKQQELEQEIGATDVRALLKEIQEELTSDAHGIELVTVARGYQLRTKYDVSLYLKDEKVKTPSRFSPSALETLAIVAYQQPITRQKIEEVRGVDSGGVLKTLLDKGIVRVVGRSDEPGRPLIYGTSTRFLEIFGLKSLGDLPRLEDYRSLQLSQTGDAQEPASPQNEITVDAFLDERNDSDLSEAEEAVLRDLDESMKDLMRVEKEVIRSQGLVVSEKKEVVSEE